MSLASAHQIFAARKLLPILDWQLHLQNRTDVRFWHKADIARLSSDVRYWGKQTLLTRDEARRIAANIAKLPNLLRKKEG